MRSDQERHNVHKRHNLTPLQKLPTSQHNGSTETEPHFISHVHAFFAPSNSIVIKNLSSNVATKVMWPTAQCFYSFQIAVGTIHCKKYSLLIDRYVKDPTEKLHLLNVIKTVPCVQHKAKWALKWCGRTNASFAKQMIAFAAVEGIFFWALSLTHFGSRSAGSCLATVSATNHHS
jgi:ribonucleotide reductase beta subunit family protein with ferritin-like domain